MSFLNEAERIATFVRAVGMYEAACIRVQVCQQDMPTAVDIRREQHRPSPVISLPTAARMREYVALFEAAIVSLEEAAAAAEVYQAADAALRLGGKVG